jgi:outer membrane biosynthesis protein TonB
MPRQPVTRARGHLPRGALLSLLLHVHLLVPIGIVIWIYAGRQQADREARLAQEIDVDFQAVDPAELPKDLPPVDSVPDELRPLKPAEPKPLREKPTELAQKKKDEQKAAEAKKDPEVVVPPLPPMPEPPAPPPPPPPDRGHEKIVDQETEKQEPPPTDADYLAQSNHKAKEQTRARNTTLEKAPRTQPEDQLPTAEKDKIAELEDQKSALGRKAPQVTPHADPEAATAEQREAARRSPLALRDPAPRTHELTPQTADPSLPKAADGEVAISRPARGLPADPARANNAKRVKLALAQKDFEYLFGADAEAERRLAQKQRSTRSGKLQQRMARVQAALENFVPEIREGNISELSTRAAPFAAYIARMHRSIHKLWGFGQLEDWDELSGSSPLNNSHLATTLEMVLNRDGTVEKVGVVRMSGYLPFDAAAVDVVYSAGPYPDPPREIRSPDGKIYLFHRDERQCTPAYARPVILAESPNANRPGTDNPEAAGAPPQAPVATPPPPPSAAGSTGEGGPRRLRRFEDGRHRAGVQRLDEEVAAAEGEGHDGHAHGPPPAQPEAAAPAAPPAARATDPAARNVAERWFKALGKGDVAALTGMSVVPFKTSGKDVTKRDVLSAMLKDLMREDVGTLSVQVFSTAGLRAAIGKLPPNVDDGTGGQLYALASGGHNDVLILILAQRGGSWKPVGLVRR